MLDLAYSLPIQKQDFKVIIGKKVYARGDFAAGIAFERGIMVVAGVLYFPHDSALLHLDRDLYPVSEKILELKSKHGKDYEDFYRCPDKNHYDVLGEAQTTNLTALQDELERARNTFEARLLCRSREQDFAYRTASGVMPVSGDKAFLMTHSTQILRENRCEISSGCRMILSNDPDALLALGCCLSSLEQQKFYRTPSSFSEDAERRLADSYT